MKMPLYLLGLALLCGCAGMPGHVSSTKSMLDGERQIAVAPGWLWGGGFSTPAKAGGFWSEKQPEVFNLKMVVIGGGDITGLKIGMDGNIQEFQPSDAATSYGQVDGHSESSRVFRVPLELIEQLVVTKGAVFQILSPDSRTEAKFLDQSSYALPALRNGLKEIHSIKSGPAK